MGSPSTKFRQKWGPTGTNQGTTGATLLEMNKKSMGKEKGKKRESITNAPRQVPLEWELYSMRRNLSGEWGPVRENDRSRKVGGGGEKESKAF